MNDFDAKPWWIFRGTREPHDDFTLPVPPKWRNYQAQFTPPERAALPRSSYLGSTSSDRGQTYLSTPHQCDIVNAAIYLRRPLLVMGKPGTGKTQLAHAIAYELNLGPALVWSITTRTTLQDGLYRYDAIGRLQAEKFADEANVKDIGQFIQLGPLGTALLPAQRPRVLLIDEIDKSDIDLPNDLLHIFEEGYFEIPELARLPETDDFATVMVRPHDPHSPRVPVQRGNVHCYEFPIVVMTSNGERDFPPAFLRRCLPLIMPDLNTADQRERLHAIIRLQTNVDNPHDADIQALIREFEGGTIATDQLLNAIFLLRNGTIPVGLFGDSDETLRKTLLRSLSQ